MKRSLQFTLLFGLLLAVAFGVSAGQGRGRLRRRLLPRTTCAGARNTRTGDAGGQTIRRGRRI